MIPADHALRCCLALKLWSIERKSHVMALDRRCRADVIRRPKCLPKEKLSSLDVLFQCHFMIITAGGNSWGSPSSPKLRRRSQAFG
jgi:hypothetical protein